VQWPTIESAVGVIDSTSTEIYHPQIEPQELYFSGNRHFHAIHTGVDLDKSSSLPGSVVVHLHQFIVNCFASPRASG
jgi:hypothetical protein